MQLARGLAECHVHVHVHVQVHMLALSIMDAYHA